MHLFSIRPRTISTVRVRASAIRAVSHWPAPQARPRLATTQTEAAVVRPWTLWWESSRRITPPPRKPMPAMTPWMVRSTAEPSIRPFRAVSSRLIKVIREAPRETRACVRIPAGLPWISRLRPSTVPMRVATKRRRKISPGPIRNSPLVIIGIHRSGRSFHPDRPRERVRLAGRRIDPRRAEGPDPERIEGLRRRGEPLVVAEEEAVRRRRETQVPGRSAHPLALGEPLAAGLRHREIFVHQHARGAAAQGVIGDSHPALGAHGHGGGEIGGLIGTIRDPLRRAPALAVVGRAGEDDLIAAGREAVVLPRHVEGSAAGVDRRRGEARARARPV